MGAVSPRPILLKSESPGSPAASPTIKQVPTTKLSISKNYVIPPRPKPGRKPSNDIPPSRRKAQNRDAQRAFRERKSQAVRVLEEQLAQQAQEFEKQQSLMREQIQLLQKQNLKLKYAPSTPSSPDAVHGVQMHTMQQQSHQNLMPILSPLPFSPGSSTSPLYLTSQSLSMQTVNTPPSPGTPFGTPVTPADVAGLELLDHVLEQKLPVSKHPSSPVSLSRRASRSGKSPELPQSPGVTRKEPPAASNPLELVNTDWSQPAVPLRRKSKSLEMDFTLAFTPRSPRPLSLPSPPALKDRCGFCTDSTPCICAASAAREEGADMAPDLATLGSPLGHSDNRNGMSYFSINENIGRSRSSSLSQRTDHIYTNTVEEGECTGNPGNCSQCRQDPMLTLFCSAVASKAPLPRTAALGTFIPAQAAYKTLSRHPRFSSADLGEVVDLLLVKSSQVEVNSVAKVLRQLDSR